MTLEKTTSTLLLLMLLLPAVVYAQEQVTVTDASITGDVVWQSDTEYLLDGYVYVEEGETLTIEAGTVIKGKADPTTGDQESALIVARGGKIFAEGTPLQPIIFTAEDDDVTDPEDLTLDDRGSWGGVLILGRAQINVGGGENAIEGLPPTDPRNTYGGTDDEDDSGVFRYASIRYGGAIFGQDNEINGLTMGAVGRGTQIDHVEVFANQDDGFEWFGGTVDTKYLVAAFCGDDMYDYDEGFRGRGQFWFGIQGSDDAGTGGEHDGGTDPETGEPFAIPVIYNATYIGAGASSLLTSNDFALTIDDNAGGKYFNSIFTDFAGAGVTIEDLASGEDSRARVEAGDLVLSNNIWFGFGDVNGTGLDAFSNVFREQYVADAFASLNQIGVDPQLSGISREANGLLDPRPESGSPALTSEVATPPHDGFYRYAGSIGAFDEHWLWTSDWTFLSIGGYSLPTSIEPISNEVPSAFSLEQNFPNPFNPSTTIEFQLALAGQVRLAVYDVLGRQVAVLADGVHPAGTYRVTFDARELASGMYLYQLEGEGGLGLVKKMLLVK
jgi:hypothetical protein